MSLRRRMAWPKSKRCWQRTTSVRPCWSSQAASNAKIRWPGRSRRLPPEVDVVLVHDAARPLAPSELVDAVASAVLAGHGAVVPGLAMTDTVKRVAPPNTRPNTGSDGGALASRASA